VRLLTGLDREAAANIYAIRRGERLKADREEAGRPFSVFAEACLAVPAETGQVSRICNLYRGHQGPHDWEPHVP
jgi:hypothetical protein